MKKLLVLISLLTMMIVLTSCGAEPVEPVPTDSVAEAEVEATVPPVQEAPKSNSVTETHDTKAVPLQLQPVPIGEEVAIIHTSMGDITIRFFEEQAPNAVNNFKTLAKAGYYDVVTFHRVIDGFVIQGGDPTGTGAGGQSMWGVPFENEVSNSLSHIRGAVCMANSGGTESNGSQFYIVQNNDIESSVGQGATAEMQQALDTFDEPRQDAAGNEFYLENYISKEILEYYIANGGTPSLDGKYTIFGQVIEGMEVVDAIAATPVDNKDKPIEPVTINSIEFVPYAG